MPRKVAFHTLGCKLNFAETSMISRKFEERGYDKVDFDTDADIYVINTCSVTHVADKKCRQAIKKATSRGAKVVVLGCYAQLKPDEIAAIEGVDLVLGTKEKFNVIEHVEKLYNSEHSKVISCEISLVNEFNASYSTSDRTRAFLKVQDGCDYACSYCTIPLARGNSRNESIASTVEKARDIAARGIREVVLTGVNIGDFGRSTDETFFGLIKELDKVDGISRYRISSIEPNLLTEEIIEFVASSNKFAHHFHIPLQSGDNKILAQMRRRYKRELFAEVVSKIKSILPYACIGADVIVGFPSETADDFESTYQFIKSLNLSYLHVFPYSERANTRAAQIDNKVAYIEKEQRSKKLIALSEDFRNSFYQKNLGREELAIFESRLANGKMIGFTSNYVQVEAAVDTDRIGQLSKVKIGHIVKSGNCEAELN